MNDKDIFEKYFIRASKANALKIFGIKDSETKHSKFLSWLLDPTENHFLEHFFLESFLKSIKTGLSDDYIHKISTKTNINVFCEFATDNNNCRQNKRFIDILLLAKNRFPVNEKDGRRKDLVLVIENKIYAKESKDQTFDYKKYVEDKFPENEFERIFVYLDLWGEKKTGYINATYKNNILPILKKFQAEGLFEKTDLIRDYITILEEKYLLLDDKEVKFLSKNHREWALRKLAECIKDDKDSLFANEKNNIDEIFREDAFYIGFSPAKSLDFKGIGKDKKPNAPMVQFILGLKDIKDPLSLVLKFILRKAANPEHEAIRREIYNNLKMHFKCEYSEDTFEVFSKEVNEYDYLELLNGKIYSFYETLLFGFEIRETAKTVTGVIEKTICK